MLGMLFFLLFFAVLAVLYLLPGREASRGLLRDALHFYLYVYVCVCSVRFS